MVQLDTLIQTLREKVRETHPNLVKKRRSNNHAHHVWYLGGGPVAEWFKGFEVQELRFCYRLVIRGYGFDEKDVAEWFTLFVDTVKEAGFHGKVKVTRFGSVLHETYVGEFEAWDTYAREHPLIEEENNRYKWIGEGHSSEGNGSLDLRISFAPFSINVISENRYRSDKLNQITFHSTDELDAWEERHRLVRLDMEEEENRLKEKLIATFGHIMEPVSYGEGVSWYEYKGRVISPHFSMEWEGEDRYEFSMFAGGGEHLKTTTWEELKAEAFGAWERWFRQTMLRDLVR